MKIPKGMTQEQVLEIIDKVATRLAYQYRFGIFDVEDIKQECYMMAVEGLVNYNGEHPLENFLSVHIRNRLKNLKRKHHYRLEATNNSKKLLSEALDIDIIDPDRESSLYFEVDFTNILDVAELTDLIEQNLPKELRKYYIKLKHGIKIPQNKMRKLVDFIHSIIEAQNEQTGQTEQSS